MGVSSIHGPVRWSQQYDGLSSTMVSAVGQLVSSHKASFLEDLDVTVRENISLWYNQERKFWLADEEIANRTGNSAKHRLGQALVPEHTALDDHLRNAPLRQEEDKSSMRRQSAPPKTKIPERQAW